MFLHSWYALIKIIFFFLISISQTDFLEIDNFKYFLKDSLNACNFLCINFSYSVDFYS